MIYFRSDYSQGSHPEILKALIETNEEHTDGYGLDPFSDKARAVIQELIGREAAGIHMMVGGTPTNVITIAAALRPYEAVVAPKTGHIYKHECGAVEHSGHKILAMDPLDGKLTPELIDKAWIEFEDDHTVLPKMAYISNTTELGTIYTKEELLALRKSCDDHEMYLYLDGARLGAALTAPNNDLTIKDIAELTDAFYIGGTKNGAMVGEAVVILNPEIDNYYRWMIKQNCGMLAKGRLIGVQLAKLLEGGNNSLFFQIGKHMNKMSTKLREGILDQGYEFKGTSCTNQIFPILPNDLIAILEKDFFFYEWEPFNEDHSVIRLVTGFGTKESDVDAFLKALENYKRN